MTNFNKEATFTYRSEKQQSMGKIQFTTLLMNIFIIRQSQR